MEDSKAVKKVMADSVQDAILVDGAALADTNILPTPLEGEQRVSVIELKNTSESKKPNDIGPVRDEKDDSDDEDEDSDDEDDDNDDGDDSDSDGDDDDDDSDEYDEEDDSDDDDEEDDDSDDEDEDEDDSD